MPSYTQYKRQMAVLDADDSEIESWITVRGNHIPIMKGQSKGDAVKSFIEKKQGSKESGSAHHYERADRLADMVSQREKELKSPNATPAMKKAIKRGIGGLQEEISKHWDKAGKLDKLAGAGRAKKEYDPAFEIDRKNALANYYLYGGKYTQRSKQAAYKEWKHDTSSEENLRAANKWVNSELVPKQSKPSDSMGRPPKKKYEGQTLGEMEKGGADVSGLRQDLNRWYYGFYVEQARKMTPQQLVDWMEDMLATSTGRVNHGEVKIQEVFPDLIKKVKGHIKGLGDSEKKLSKPSDASGGGSPFESKPSANETGEKTETINGLKYITHKDPNGYEYKVYESGNDVGWKASNLPTEWFESEEEAKKAASEQLKKDIEYYNDSAKATKVGKRLFEKRYNVFKEEPEPAKKERKPRQKRSKPDNMVYQDKKHPNVFYVDEKAWNSPANDPWYGLYN